MNDLSLQMTGGTLLQYADDTALICSKGGDIGGGGGQEGLKPSHFSRRGG